MNKKTLLLDVTNNCNLNCIHCYNANAIKDKQDIRLDDIFKIVKEKNVEHIHLIGGEPLLFKKLDKLIDKNKELIFSINTNGILINSIIENGLLFNRNIKEITISIDGFDSKTNDRIRGKGTYNIVSQEIDKLIKFRNKYRSDLKILLSVVILPDNAQNLQELNIKNFTNVDNFLISTMYMEGNALNNIKTNESFYHSYIKIIENIINSEFSQKFIIDTTPLYMYMYEIHGELCKCNDNNDVIYSDNKGNIYSCIPEKFNLDKSNNNININGNMENKICMFCKFYSECKVCKFNLFLDRYKYCEALISYLFEKYKKVKIKENVIIKRYLNNVFIISVTKNNILKLHKNLFEKLFYIEDEYLIIKCKEYNTQYLEYFKILINRYSYER